MEITYIFTMISLLIVITFFVFLSIQGYYKRKYDNIQDEDEKSIHYILKHTKIQIGSYYTYKHPEFEARKRKITSVRLLHDDNNGGYHIELNNEIIVDKNTTIYYE